VTYIEIKNQPFNPEDDDDDEHSAIELRRLRGQIAWASWV